MTAITVPNIQNIAIEPANDSQSVKHRSRVSHSTTNQQQSLHAYQQPRRSCPHPGIQPTTQSPCPARDLPHRTPRSRPSSALFAEHVAPGSNRKGRATPPFFPGEGGAVLPRILPPARSLMASPMDRDLVASGTQDGYSSGLMLRWQRQGGGSWMWRTTEFLWLDRRCGSRMA